VQAEPTQNELTTTLHLSLAQVSDSPAGVLDEYLATLPQADRSIIEEIAGSKDKAMVVINKGSNLGSRYLINTQGVTIGRSTTSDIFLDDVTVSRAHAVIEMRPEGFVLKDSGSLNGTYVNNVSVSSKDLNSGDQIQIGKFHMIFVSGRK
jgi:hypothetical protein